MAKHGKRRFNLRRVRVTPSLALGTLSPAIVIAGGISGAASNTYRAVSVHMTWTAELLLEGPVIVGYAHSDYTITEIKESIEASASIDPGRKIEREKANRLVRLVGALSPDEDSLNDGRPVKTKLNWLIAPGDEVNAFAYNDSSAVLTTGAIIHPTGTLWVKDSV